MNKNGQVADKPCADIPEQATVNLTAEQQAALYHARKRRRLGTK